MLSKYDLLNNPQFNTFLEASPGIVGIFNYDTLKYEYMSENIKNILGYSAKDYIEGGLNYSYSNLHATHADIIATNIFPIFLEYCVKYAENGGLKKLRFSYDYLINCKNGRTKWCLQQLNIIELDDTGYPLLDLFFITDINEIKKDDLINFTIACKNEAGLFETIFSISYPTRDLTLLSGREMQILKLLCEGKSTPQIANLIHLSEHTVKTHRKNIMNKLEVKNSIDIMKIAYEKGLL